MTLLITLSGIILTAKIVPRNDEQLSLTKWYWGISVAICIVEVCRPQRNRQTRTRARRTQIARMIKQL